MATSRESLDAEGESVFELALARDPPDNVGSEAELDQYSSTRLFMECAVAAGFATTVSDADAEIVARSAASSMACHSRSSWSLADYRHTGC